MKSIVPVIYVLVVLFLGGAGFAAAGAVVVQRDPEARIDASKLMFAADYISKPIMMRTVERDALVIGSSRIMEINPDKLSGFKAYNAGFGGITPENMLELLELYARADDTIIIGIDLYMMNEFHTPLQGQRWQNERAAKDDMLGTVAGYIAPDNSVAGRVLAERDYVFNIGTVVRALAGQDAGMRGARGARIPTTYANGQIFNSDKLTVHKVCLGATPPPLCAQGYNRVIDQTMAGHFGRFDYSVARVETFRKMRVLLDSRGTRYVVMINPEHRAFWPVVHGAMAQYTARFKKDVRDSFANVCDYLTEAYADPTLYYATDPFHYLPETGERLANECLAKFGLKK